MVVQATALAALEELAEAVVVVELSVQAAQAQALLIKDMLAAQISILGLREIVLGVEAVVRRLLVEMA